MSIIHKAVNSQAALRYVAASLAVGHSLAHSILACLPERATIVAAVPSWVPDDMADRFDHGGLFSHPLSDGSSSINDLSDHLARTIVRELSTTNGAFCIIEEPFVRPTDSQPPDVPYVIISGEIFYVIDRNTSQSAAREILEFAGVDSTLVAAVSPRQSSMTVLDVPSSAGQAVLDDVTRNATCIVVGAYDGEGYLVVRW